MIDEQWNRIEVAGLDPGTTRRDLAYNLTVEGIHTYHVGAADILVHNTGHDCGTGAGDDILAASDQAGAANGGDDALQAARAARDAKAAEVGRSKATVTGGYGPDGRPVAGCSSKSDRLRGRRRGPSARR